MHIHILGIAGTMTAPLAVALKQEGNLVTGSDQEKIYPPISTILKNAGIKINSTPINSQIDLAIIGSSFSNFQNTKDEFDQIKEKKIKYILAADFVAQKIIKENSVLIAGTYGKTTITSLVSWIFSQANLNPNYMFGGKSVNKFPSVNFSPSNWSIVEADESIHGLEKQAKFLYYPVKFLLLTSADWEHKDSYKNELENFNAFKALINKLPKDGILFINKKGHQTKELSLFSSTKTITYNSPDSDYSISNIKVKPKYTILKIKTPKNIFSVKTKLIGQFNFENILAAITVADSFNIPLTKIKQSITKYKGVKRRIEKVFDHRGIQIFDDFAQSPNRIKSVIEAINFHFPKNNIKVLYQPHASFIQYKESLLGLDKAFTSASEVVLSKLNFQNINKERRVTAKDFKEIIKDKLNYIPIDQEIIKYFQKTLKPKDILINMSSGGLDGNKLIKSIINSLK